MLLINYLHNKNDLFDRFNSDIAILDVLLDQPVNTTYSQSPGLEWRFSFSQPEMFLAAIIPREARSAYIALKAVNKKYFSHHIIKPLPSYAMKCLLLQMMEETEASYWELHHNAVDIFIKMLDILHQHLTNKVFPHYWIPSINLFKDLDNTTLDLICHKVVEVRHNPQKYVADNWLELTRCLRLKCCSFCAFGKRSSLFLTLLSRVLSIKRKICPCCLIPWSYSEEPFWFGPCPYDKVNMDVY